MTKPFIWSPTTVSAPYFWISAHFTKYKFGNNYSEDVFPFKNCSFNFYFIISAKYIFSLLSLVHTSVTIAIKPNVN